MARGPPRDRRAAARGVRPQVGRVDRPPGRGGLGSRRVQRRRHPDPDVHARARAGDPGAAEDGIDPPAPDRRRRVARRRPPGVHRRLDAVTEVPAGERIEAVDDEADGPRDRRPHLDADAHSLAELDACSRMPVDGRARGGDRPGHARHPVGPMRAVSRTHHDEVAATAQALADLGRPATAAGAADPRA